MVQRGTITLIRDPYFADQETDTKTLAHSPATGSTGPVGLGGPVGLRPTAFAPVNGALAPPQLDAVVTDGPVGVPPVIYTAYGTQHAKARKTTRCEYSKQHV